jgi:hypothetical protein
MVRISPHPPDFTSIPWFNLVVRVINPPVNLTTILLQAAMSQQLGITFTLSNVDVRLQMVRVWGALATGTSALQLLSVAIFDTIQTTQGTVPRVLEQITDFPDQVTRACIGYRYPKAQRETSLRLTNINPITLLAIDGAGPNSVAYFNLQWRPTANLPTIQDWIKKALNTQPLSDDEDSEVEIVSTKSHKMRNRA